MNRRDFIFLAGSAPLICLPVQSTFAALAIEPQQAPVRPSYPDEKIIGILNQVTGYGSFSQTKTRSDGQVMTYRFAWAVGMGSLHYRSRYREYFDEVEPSWALLEHPYHQCRLFREAVEADLPLPATCPIFPRSAT